MTRTPIVFAVDDISALAKSLRKQMQAQSGLPSHVALLNMLARAAGCRNFQHLRGTAALPTSSPDRPPRIAASDTPDLILVERVLRHFDDQGRLVRWPARRSQQLLSLWALWSGLPARQSLDDAGMKALLTKLHSFQDHALLRRELVDSGLVTRTVDGRDYRRHEKRPPADAMALIRRIRSAKAA